MENDAKTYPAGEIGFSVDWVKCRRSAKEFFFYLLSPAAFLLRLGLSAICFLILQVSLVGVFDRFGVSPKYSVLVSCFFYAAIFAGLAITGGLGRKQAADAEAATPKPVIGGADINSSPICKMLIIKRRSREIKI